MSRPQGKNPLRDKLEEDILDLSLLQLQEVPVNEIVSLFFVLEPGHFHVYNIQFHFRPSCPKERPWIYPITS